MVENIINNIISGSNFIPVLVLKTVNLNFITYWLIFQYRFKTCFLDWWKVSSVVCPFKNVREKFLARNYFPISLKLLKSLKKLVALDIFKALNKVWHAGLFLNFKSYGISGQVFSLFQLFLGIISSFLSNKQLWVILDGKYSQEHLVKLVFNKIPFFVLHFFYYTLMTFYWMLSVTLLFMLMILTSTQIVIRFWFMATTRFAFWIYLFLLTGLITQMLLLWKWIGLFLKKRHILRCWDCSFLLNWTGVHILSLLLKMPTRRVSFF